MNKRIQTAVFSLYSDRGVAGFDTGPGSVGARLFQRERGFRRPLGGGRGKDLREI